MARYSNKQLEEMVYSQDAALRSKAAERGFGLDVLVNDKDAGVRAKVAQQGYGLEKLVNDPYYWVRVCVADQGYGLDRLLHDDDWMVRAAVAERGYGLESLIADTNPCVRARVALQGYGLDVLFNDPDFRVRQCVARQQYGLDILAKDPEPRVRMVVKDVMKDVARQKKLASKANADKCINQHSVASKPCEDHGEIPPCRFNLGDKVKIPYIYDGDKHNGAVGEVVSIYPYKVYPGGDENNFVWAYQMEIVYPDGQSILADPDRKLSGVDSEMVLVEANTRSPLDSVIQSAYTRAAGSQPDSSVKGKESELEP